MSVPKIRSKLAKLDASLDQLEAQLEPLFAQSLPETLLALDTLQQAKLQVIIPYVVYDLVFVYLKSRGIDPKTHRVVAELERIREYFDKIKNAEESSQKRKPGIDKAAAERFIKHAIAQAKNAPSIDEGEPSRAVAAASSSSHERVPVTVTNKMTARATYEKELERLGSEEEDDLQVFDEDMAVDEEPMDTAEGLPEETRFTKLEKGKGRASEMEQIKDKEVASSKRKKPCADRDGYENPSVSGPILQTADESKKAKLSTSTQPSLADTSSRGNSTSAADDREARKTARKAKRKSKQS